MKIALTGGIACGKSLVAKFFRELGFRTLDADDVVHALEAPGGEAVSAIVARFGRGVLSPSGGIDRAALAARVFGRAEPGRQDSPPPPDRAASPWPPSPLPPPSSFSLSAAPASSSSARRDLEAILHPLVRTRLLSFFSAPPSPSSPLTLDGKALPEAYGKSAPSPDGKALPCQIPPRRIAIIPLLFESHWEADYDIILCVASSEDRQIDRMMRTRGYTRAQAEARLAAQLPVAEKAARAAWTIRNDSTPEDLEAETRRCAAWLAEQWNA